MSLGECFNLLADSAGGYLSPITQDRCEDDLDFLTSVLFYAAKVYDKKSDSSACEKKIREQLEKELCAAEKARTPP